MAKAQEGSNGGPSFCICASCERAGRKAIKPVTEFSVSSRRPDGTIYYQSYCKKCRAMKQRIKKRGLKIVSSAGKRVDAQPFVDWLSSLPLSNKAIGRATNTNEARIRRLKSGAQKTVTVDLVDRFIIALEAPITLEELYPYE